MFETIAEIFNTIRWGSLQSIIAFVHPDDFAFVNDVRMTTLRESGVAPFTIQTSDDASIAGTDADGNNRVDYGCPKPGHVIFVEERSRGVFVRTMTHTPKETY